MSTVQKVVTALPPVEVGQDQIRAMGKKILKGRIPFVDQALGMITNAGVKKRHLVAEPDDILANDTLGWRNQTFSEWSVRLGEDLCNQLFADGQVSPQDIDFIITTSCTGFMIPAVDAHLINTFKMRPDIKRLPITELGCAGGAMALSRAHEYLRGFPEHRVLVIAIELPSMTYRTRDFRVANLVSAALFGDGAAACLLDGRDGPCRILGGQTHFFPATLGYMGFDLDETGFKIILDKKIPALIESGFYPIVTGFLQRYGWTLEDLQHFVFHPGGRKILDTMRAVLHLEESQIEDSRYVLQQVGNLSSASVMWVLKQALARKKAGKGLMTAFGPGFNAELLALEFAANGAGEAV